MVGRKSHYFSLRVGLLVARVYIPNPAPPNLLTSVHCDKAISEDVIDIRAAPSYGNQIIDIRAAPFYDNQIIDIRAAPFYVN